ncbi:MAG: 1-acyl-sn-glycerol-3-phosphate acyltransferase [Flavobacteriaceae bacterium]|nr:1-acyl-sn-glycerol-3-phosphate acyltransferase [Flavobacteriaceae bacterium]
MLYTFLKYYVRLCLFFYHKKIKVVGKENIPKNGAVLFISNHPNALLDPILIVTNNVRDIHFLSRASAFKNNIIAKFLKSIKMIPVYRKRDGVDILVENRSTFSKSVELMRTKKTLYIAAEGSHNVQRRVRELKKGFVHVIHDTLKKHPEVNIQIIPIGLNYDTVLDYSSSVAVYYGKPINVKEYYVKNDSLPSTNKLLKVVRNSMKTLTTHIENEESYDKILNKLNALNVDYLNPVKTNEIIESLDDYSIDTQKHSTKKRKSLLYYFVVLNSLIPWIIWKKLEKNIKEKEFISTFRFAVGSTLFPLFYIIQSLIISCFFGNIIALIYFGCSILIGLLLTKTSKI